MLPFYRDGSAAARVFHVRTQRPTLLWRSGATSMKLSLRQEKFRAVVVFVNMSEVYVAAVICNEVSLNM